MSETAPTTRYGRVFITGTLGFIGSALAERYRSLGADVRGVDVRGAPDLGVVAGDIRRPGLWQRHAEGCDLVIHCAALVTNTAPLEPSWQVNVLGTRRALDAAVRGGARRLLHFSSVRAFSDTAFPDGVDETWPVHPDGNPYVDTKIASEQVVFQAHAAGEVAATIVRPGDVYGPGSRPWTVLPVELLRSGLVALPAMGRGVFSPVYIDDLVDGVVAAAEHPDAAGEVFTLTGGEAVTTREFFGHYSRMLGKRPPPGLPTPVVVALAGAQSTAARLRRAPTEQTPATVRYLARRGTYSIAKARRVLGYAPRVDLAEGMRRTEAWLRAHGHL